MNEPAWLPLKKMIPEELLDDWMYMGMQGVDIYLYKHRDTRKYLNIDTKGQCWMYNANLGIYQPIDALTALEEIK